MLADLLARLLPLRITFDVDPMHDVAAYWDHAFSLMGRQRWFEAYPAVWLDSRRMIFLHGQRALPLWRRYGPI